MSLPLAVERDTEILIDNQLRNLGWNNDPHSPKRNVYQQRVKTETQRVRLHGKRPDYILYRSTSDTPIAVIEAKRKGQKVQEALQQGIEYAQQLDAPLVFATDGVFTKTYHVKASKPLVLNGEEIDELIRESLALRYLATNDVSTLDKQVIKSRGELISISSSVNDLLREEGLQKGLERFTEFANVLFLKVLSETEDAKEEHGEKSRIAPEYRWNYFKNKKGNELLSYVSDTVLQWFSKEYKDDNIFQRLQIKHPENLKHIIDKLDPLQLTDINADIKGDAFEYFIRSYSASNPSDLGEIFTPRHIVKTIVRLVKPQIGERIYDPFCGTGGMLVVAFKYLMDTMPRNLANLETLRERTVYGADITKTASIAKMNMILAGDGHNNVQRLDSLANPVDNKYEIVITNMPFAQKTRYGDRYPIPSRNGDIVCPQACLRAVREGGRMAIIGPEGFLSNTNSKAYVDVRKWLMDNATLKSVVSLPRGAFEPYNRAKADILYFTDIKTSRTQGHYWFFDVQNDGYTLDKRRTPIIGGNDLELVLSENNLEDQSEDYLMSVGITKIDLDKVEANNYILNAAHYRELYDYSLMKYRVFSFNDVFEMADNKRVGAATDIPIMSITMTRGLIDQKEKFKKRVASADISGYLQVKKNDLVVGFPIDEGVLGFQFKYPVAAVSPAYTIWRVKPEYLGKLSDPDTHLRFLDILLRSPVMREVYKFKMQGAVDRRRTITPDLFLGIKVPIPPQNIQKAIVGKRKEIEEANQKIKKLEHQVKDGLNELWAEKIGDGGQRPIGDEFQALAKKWKRDTQHFSSVAKMSQHSAYRQIISMGHDVLPYLFKELSKSPDHWFIALNTITGEDPVPDKSTFDQAVQEWLKWGKERGYLE